MPAPTRRQVSSVNTTRDALLANLETLGGAKLGRQGSRTRADGERLHSGRTDRPAVALWCRRPSSMRTRGPRRPKRRSDRQREPSVPGKAGARLAIGAAPDQNARPSPYGQLGAPSSPVACDGRLLHPCDVSLKGRDFPGHQLAVVSNGEETRRYRFAPAFGPRGLARPCQPTLDLALEPAGALAIKAQLIAVAGDLSPKSGFRAPRPTPSYGR